MTTERVGAHTPKARVDALRARWHAAYDRLAALPLGALAVQDLLEITAAMQTLSGYDPWEGWFGACVDEGHIAWMETLATRYEP